MFRSNNPAKYLPSSVDIESPHNANAQESRIKKIARAHFQAATWLLNAMTDIAALVVFAWWFTHPH